MKRLNEVFEPLKLMLNALQLPYLEKQDGTLLVESQNDKYLLELRDHTGPILLGEFDGWLAGLPQATHGILVSMGFFHPKVFQVIIEKSLLNTIALIEMGLHSFYEEEIHARFFGESDNEVFTSLISAFISLDVPPSAVMDYYGRGKAMSFCFHCNRLLSKHSFMTCPLCTRHICHPDVCDCYFKHECKPGGRGL